MKDLFLAIPSQMVNTLNEIKLSLSHLWILYRIQNKEVIPESIQLSHLYQTLVRKEYLTSSGKLTVSAESLLQALDTPVTIEVPKMLSDLVDICSQNFEEFWLAYPSNDRVTHNSKVLFKETRSLRTYKDRCKNKYFDILKEGVSHEDIMRSLKYEIELRKKNSIDQHKNNMTFMTNSLTYLNQRGFEGFMEISKTEQVTRKPQSDIQI